MREIWSLNLLGAPDGAIEQPDMVVSACAWSDDGLLAFASSASRPAAQAALCGYTSTPSIYVVHVDHPERHSQLSGGHEHDISHLSWIHRQMGTVLMSADVRTSICLWKPVQVLPHRLLFCIHVRAYAAARMGLREIAWCLSASAPVPLRLCVMSCGLTHGPWDGDTCGADAADGTLLACSRRD
jgi:hypothetical protein